jgi:hypothetical protein
MPNPSSRQAKEFLLADSRQALQKLQALCPEAGETLPDQARGAAGEAPLSGAEERTLAP